MELIKNTQKRHLLYVCTILTLLFSFPGHTTKLYKWVDASGNISYQSKPPPENAKILHEETLDPDESASSKEGEPGPVVVYTVDNCDSCIVLLSRLEDMGVPVQEKSLQNNREEQRVLIKLSGSLTVPTMMINGNIVTDTSSSKLRTILRQAGYSLTKKEASNAQPGQRSSEETEGRGEYE